MATTQGNRKILDLKRWEFCTPAPVASAAGMFVIPSNHVKQQPMYVTSATAQYLYNASEDGFTQVPQASLATAIGAGSSGCSGAWSTGATVGAASLTATGGSTTTIITNQTLARDLRGYSVHILSGPNAGLTIPIVSNTIGALATITVGTQSSAFTSSTVYRLITPRYYVLAAGIPASGSFRVYDYATNAWQSLSITNLPTTALGTDGMMVSTPSWIGSNYVAQATGTATSATTTTLVNSAKTWTTNQWTNYQIRIVSGTGAGQIRTIASNTGTELTVATWTTTPDNTSVYSIEGNDDFLYYFGNGAVTAYKYQISTNTWAALSPVSARAAAPVAGMSASWHAQATDSAWTNESAIINGRRIYSFRGTGALLDYYDIPGNTWVSGVSYSPATEAFNTGSKYIANAGNIYIQSAATGRWFRHNLVTSEQDGLTTLTYTQGAAVVGNTAFDVTYTDGATTITYLYMILNTSTVMLREMVI